MSLTSRSLFTQLNYTINPTKFYVKNPKISLLLHPKPFLNPLNIHTPKSHFSNLTKIVFHHHHHWPIQVKPLQLDGNVERRRNATDDINFDAFLSILEFLCLASSAVISIVSAVNSSLPGFRKLVLGLFGNRVLVWQCVILVVGVVAGAIIRRRQWRRVCNADFSRPVNLVERIEKLEEDLKSSAEIIRVLSRQLEKLGTQFRVSRKALKEPIAEAAALAQKNSEATGALAMQEDILEKELGEIQKVLLAMQEQQQKQLELILAIGKSGKLWEKKREHNHEENATDASNPPMDRVQQLGPNQIQALAGQKDAID